MGLLDFLQQPDAQLGIGLLAAGGPTTDPNRTGIGQRLAGALQSVDANRDADLKRQYVKSQIDENTAQIAARQMQAQRDAQINGMIMSRFGNGAPQPPLASMSGAPPSTGFSNGGTAPDGFASAPVGSAPSSPGAGYNPSAPVQGPGAAQSSGSFPLSLNDLALLSTAGAKNAGDLFNMYKYSTDGVKQEAGNYYKDPSTGAVRYMPKLDNGMGMVNGAVAPMSGYSASNALIKGQEAGSVAGAKMPFDVMTDRARQVTGAQLQTKSVIGADGNSYEVPLYNLAQGQGGAAGGGSQGGAPGSAPAAFPGAFQSGRNPITQQSAVALNDNWIKSTYQPTLDAGKTATDLQSSIQAVRNVNMNTGWGAEQKAAGAAMLEGLGINVGNSKLFASSAQKFQSVAMDKLLTTLAAQKGPQTEGDSTRAQQTFVKLSNTPDANAFIMDFAQAKANMDQRRAQYYEQALPLAQKAGDLTRVDREWRKIQGSVWADPVLQPWAK
ncbi:hypothetical protein H7F36_02840 [Variovorax sp. PAMC28562]|uniref:hypothetical protein n=1 Tax=Variovorax sp. PAMC28562 TaxID=2762323 RepID=UPI00164D63E2|nr:hypothetical protein [Variovorax sp. PAMC28562]QNK74202.1 hypothetical protein H7F36_02840 [Variovorax sp. PAMC28562]